MSNFQLALALGIFLGVLATFVVLGIIQLYVEERQGKSALARKRTIREPREVSGILSYAKDRFPDPVPVLALEAHEAEREAVIYYLYIIIE
jgi:hypothetical protein